MSNLKINNPPVIKEEEDSPFDNKSYEPKDSPVDIESIQSRLERLEDRVDNLNNDVDGLRSLSQFIDKYRWILCVLFVCIIALVIYVFRIHYEWREKAHIDLKEYVNMQLQEIRKNQDIMIENKFLNYKYIQTQEISNLKKVKENKKSRRKWTKCHKIP